MIRRFLTVFIAAVLLLTLCAACSSEPSGAVTEERAKQIVMEDLGISADQVTDIHSHMVDQDGTICYNIHISYQGKQKTYLIHGITGEILSSKDGGH